MEWSGGGKWDNCNSIINKYIKKKKKEKKKTPTNTLKFVQCSFSLQPGSIQSKYCVPKLLGLVLPTPFSRISSCNEIQLGPLCVCIYTHIHTYIHICTHIYSGRIYILYNAYIFSIYLCVYMCVYISKRYTRRFVTLHPYSLYPIHISLIFHPVPTTCSQVIISLVSDLSFLYFFLHK